MIILRNKLFFLNEYARGANGQLTKVGAIGNGQGYTASNINQVISNGAAAQKVAEKEAAKQAARAGLTNSAKQARAAQAGFKRGANSVGIMGGLKNTWAKAGIGGKAGMIAAGVTAGGLMAKGLLGGSNNK